MLPVPAGTEPTSNASAYAKALKHGLAGGGWSLRQVSLALADQGTPIAPATLSGWLTKPARPPLSELGFRRVRALERVLGVPPTVPLPRAGDEPTVREARFGRRMGEVELHIKQAGGADSRTGLIVTQAEEHYRVGPDGFPRGSRITLTVNALRPGIRSYWFRHCHEADEGRPIVTAVENCQVGTLLTEASYRHAPPDQEPHVIDVAEIVLDKTLAPYESYQMTYEVARSYRPDAKRRTAGEFRRSATGANCEQLIISVAFEGNPPSRLQRGYWPESECQTTPMPGRPVAGLHDEQKFRNPPPGLYGWTWTWDGSPGAIEGST